jgi:hypothetical protein
MSGDFITRNLNDQSQNFGQESVVGNSGGARQFFDGVTGQAVARALNASAWDLNNSPLDNSFQLDPTQYAVAAGMFQTRAVPTNLSNTYGAVAAITAKLTGKSPQQVFRDGVMTPEMLDNVNFFRTPASQIGYNDGAVNPPWLNNLMLNAKISSQTT